MKIAIEISMYPLTEDYENEVLAFIEELKTHPIHRQTNGMSTQIFGEYEEVMNAVNQSIKTVYTKGKKAVFNMKVLNNPLPEDFSI